MPPAPPAPEQPRLPPGVDEVPKTGRIAYRTTYTRMRGMQAMTFVDWIVDAGRGRYELWLRTVDPAGLLDLKSSGSLQGFGIAPEKYVERVEIANRELRAEFDWTARVVQFAGRGAGQPAGFLEGVQDPLSLQFHLPLLAQAYPERFTPGAEISFQVARRNVETYVFRAEAFEPVRIGDRDVRALKLDRPRGPKATPAGRDLDGARVSVAAGEAALHRHERRGVGQRARRPARARSSRANRARRRS